MPEQYDRLLGGSPSLHVVSKIPQSRQAILTALYRYTALLRRRHRGVPTLVPTNPSHLPVPSVISFAPDAPVRPAGGEARLLQPSHHHLHHHRQQSLERGQQHPAAVEGRHDAISYQQSAKTNTGKNELIVHQHPTKIQQTGVFLHFSLGLCNMAAGATIAGHPAVYN